MIISASIFILSAILMLSYLYARPSVRALTKSYYTTNYYRRFTFVHGRARNACRERKAREFSNVLSLRLAHLKSYVSTTNYKRYLSVLPRYRGVTRVKYTAITVLRKKSLAVGEKDIKLMCKYLASVRADFLERAFLPYAIIGALNDLVLKRISNRKISCASDSKKLKYARELLACQKLLQNDTIFTQEYRIFAKNTTNIMNSGTLSNTRSAKLLSKIGNVVLEKISDFELTSAMVVKELPGKRLKLILDKSGGDELQYFGKTLLSSPPEPYRQEWIERDGRAWFFEQTFSTHSRAEYVAKQCRRSVQNFGNISAVVYTPNAPCTLIINRIVTAGKARLERNGSVLCVETEDVCIEMRLLGEASWTDVRIFDGDVLHARISLSGRAQLITCVKGDLLLSRALPELAEASASLTEYVGRIGSSVPVQKMVEAKDGVEYKNVLAYRRICDLIPSISGIDEARIDLTVKDDYSTFSVRKDSFSVNGVIESKRSFGDGERVNVCRITGNCAVSVSVANDFRLKRGQLSSKKQKIELFGTDRAFFDEHGRLTFLPKDGVNVVVAGVDCNTYGVCYPVQECPFSVEGDVVLMNELKSTWNGAFGVGSPDVFEAVCVARLVAYANKGAVKEFLTRAILFKIWQDVDEFLLIHSLAFWYVVTFGENEFFSVNEVRKQLIDISSYESLDKGQGVLLAYCIHKVLGLADVDVGRLNEVDALEKVVIRCGFDYSEVMDFCKSWLMRYAFEKRENTGFCAESALRFIDLLEEGMGLSFACGRLKIGEFCTSDKDVTVGYVGNGANVTVEFRASTDEKFCVDGVRRNVREVPLKSSAKKILVHYRPYNLK